MNGVLGHNLHLLRPRWQAIVALGVALIVLGCVCIAASFTATLATVFFIGCLVLGAAFVQLIELFNTRGWAGSFGHAVAMILYGVVGGYMITHPALSALSLTLLIGLLLSVGGFYEIVSSLLMSHKTSGWSFLHGLVSLSLGVLVFRQWPVSALWVIGVFVGIDLIFRGIATMMLGQGARTIALTIEGKPLGFEDRRKILDRRVA